MDFFGPLPAFNFYISLIDASASPLATAASVASDFLLGGFSECSGLESEIQIEDYRAAARTTGYSAFPHEPTTPTSPCRAASAFPRTFTFGTTNS